MKPLLKCILSRVFAAGIGVLSFSAFAQTCPLCWAAAADDANAIQNLIARGEDPDAPLVYGARPVHYAARHTSRNAYLALYNAGADTGVTDIRGLNPLMVGVLTCNSNAVTNGLAGELVFHGLLNGNLGARDNQNFTALEMAVIKDCGVYIDRLLSNNVLSYYRDSVLAGNRPDGLTPLHFAAAHGRTNAAMNIVESGENFGVQVLNRRADNGTTPLMMAAYYGHDDIVRWLVENGADPDLQDDNGLPAGAIFWYRAAQFDNENRAAGNYGWLKTQGEWFGFEDNCGEKIADYPQEGTRLTEGNKFTNVKPCGGGILAGEHEIEYRLLNPFAEQP